MVYDQIKFRYEIVSVGVTKVEDFGTVVCEIRYNFIGTFKNKEKERLYVQLLDTSKLDTNTFKKIKDVTQEDILVWLEQSIHEDNLADMKQAMHEQLHPKVTYMLPGLFKEKSGS